MVTPTFADYVELLFTLFERFWQQEAARSHRGRPFVYQHKALIVFFVVMQQRRLFRFKAVVLKKSVDSNRLKSTGSFHIRRGVVASA